MPTESVFDDTASRKLEATYLTPDVVQQRRATLRALMLRPGERVLDVGSGPWLLAAEMAQEIGPAGQVTGIDISDPMLTLGQRRCADLDRAGRVSFVKADATALPFADATFDVAVSTQVYKYVADLHRARRAAPGTAPWRAGADPGHRLGLHRLAGHRPRRDGTGAGCMDPAVRRPPSASHAGQPAPGCRLPRQPP